MIGTYSKVLCILENSEIIYLQELIICNNVFKGSKVLQNETHTPPPPPPPPHFKEIVEVISIAASQSNDVTSIIYFFFPEGIYKLQFRVLNVFFIFSPNRLNFSQHIFKPSPHNLVGKHRGLENWSLVRPPAQPIFFQRIDGSHCGRIHSSLTAFHCLDGGYVGKQPVTWKEYCVERW